ncbi:hypothetical protein V8E54_001961 [Elaphomyces granulatus]|jgi:hypothetical protein
MLDYVCQVAYNQMSDEHDALGLDNENKPATVAAMMGPGKSVVVISSSTKKVYGAGTAGRYYYQNPDLKALLDAAIPAGAKPHQLKHRTGGCAEIGCLSVWEKLYAQQQAGGQQQQGGQLVLAGSTIVTWGMLKEKLQRIAPCYQGRGSAPFGCNELLNAHRIITAIAPAQEDKNLPNFRQCAHPGF